MLSALTKRREKKKKKKKELYNIKEKEKEIP